MPKHAVDLDQLAATVEGEKDSSDLADSAEKLEEMEQQAPATEMMAAAVSISTRTKAHVQAVTDFILNSIHGMRAELDDLERLALDDCARVKGELDGHVLSAQAMVQAVGELKELGSQIRDKRQSAINGLPRATA